MIQEKGWGGPLSLLLQGTLVMGCQGLVQGSRQELVQAALPVALQQGNAVRGGWQHPPAWQGGLGRADAPTSHLDMGPGTRRQAWREGKDRSERFYSFHSAFHPSRSGASN